jgi:hypothetical protein
MRRVAGWLADSLRVPGAMLYWNWRKWLFVRRGRRDRCPCQDQSDDSVPGRVRCEAILHWRDPARFRKVCPLLAQTPEGWRCSVHASAVRPFWGRMARWWALAVFVVYLGGATVAWLGVRAAGRAPVGWLQMALPWRWSEIRSVQGAHLFRRAIDAFAQGRLPEARLALVTVRELDPRNYDATLLLAQISMFERSFLFSDELFMSLWRQHPEQRARTAVTYHDTLLSLDRMQKLAEFSVAMAQADSARAVIWVRSALLGVRSMRAAEAAEFSEKQAAALAALAPHAQLLLRAELQLRTGDEITALATLHRRFTGALNPFYLHYQVERLAGLGAAGDAQLLFDSQGAPLGDFDRLLTQTALSLIAGDATLARGSFRALLRQPLNASRVERLAGLLITHPEPAFYRDLVARVRGEPALAALVDGATLWVTGLACGVPDEAAGWQEQGRQPARARYPAIPALNFASRDLLASDSVLHLVNVVTFPREVILALLGRMAPQAAAKAGPARR